jgi:hypothetical protein
MSGNKRYISLDDISKEVLKAFTLASIYKKKTISKIVSKLYIKHLFDISYRGIDFSSESLIRCIIFMKLKGLNQSNLEDYLKKNKNERKRLGLKKPPDQTTISFFYGKKLSTYERELITSIIEKIEQIAQKEGIELDKIPVKLKKRKKQSKRRIKS